MTNAVYVWMFGNDCSSLLSILLSNFLSIKLTIDLNLRTILNCENVVVVETVANCYD